MVGIRINTGLVFRKEPIDDRLRTPATFGTSCLTVEVPVFGMSLQDDEDELDDDELDDDELVDDGLDDDELDDDELDDDEFDDFDEDDEDEEDDEDDEDDDFVYGDEGF